MPEKLLESHKIRGSKILIDLIIITIASYLNCKNLRVMKIRNHSQKNEK